MKKEEYVRYRIKYELHAFNLEFYEQNVINDTIDIDKSDNPVDNRNDALRKFRALIEMSDFLGISKTAIQEHILNEYIHSADCKFEIVCELICENRMYGTEITLARWERNGDPVDKYIENWSVELSWFKVFGYSIDEAVTLKINSDRESIEVLPYAILEDLMLKSSYPLDDHNTQLKRIKNENLNTKEKEEQKKYVINNLLIIYNHSLNERISIHDYIEFKEAESKIDNRIEALKKYDMINEAAQILAGSKRVLRKGLLSDYEYWEDIRITSETDHFSRSLSDNSEILPDKWHRKSNGTLVI